MMKIKAYIATMLTSTNEETTRTVEAVSIASAKKKARELAESNSMTVLNVELITPETEIPATTDSASDSTEAPAPTDTTTSTPAATTEETSTTEAPETTPKAKTNGWQKIAKKNIKSAYNWHVGEMENSVQDGQMTEEELQDWIHNEAFDIIYQAALSTEYDDGYCGGTAPKEMRFAGKKFCEGYLKRLFEDDGYDPTPTTPAPEKSKKSKTATVILKAFTGMVIGEYEAKVTKTGYTITTKKGELEFNKDGTQKIDCRNAKFNNRIEVVK